MANWLKFRDQGIVHLQFLLSSCPLFASPLPREMNGSSGGIRKTKEVSSLVSYLLFIHSVDADLYPT